MLDGARCRDGYWDMMGGSCVVREGSEERETGRGWLVGNHSGGGMRWKRMTDAELKHAAAG